MAGAKKCSGQVIDRPEHFFVAMVNCCRLAGLANNQGEEYLVAQKVGMFVAATGISRADALLLSLTVMMKGWPLST